jgi:hypothetical protein
MMSNLDSLLLLALRSGWRHYGYRKYTGEYFEANSGEAWTVLGLTALLVVGILLWRLVASRSGDRIPSNSPRRLFRELCRAHGLDMARRRLLKRLAAARGELSPAVLFVQPECFDVDSLPHDWRDAASDIAELGERLFGSRDRS